MQLFEIMPPALISQVTPTADLVSEVQSAVSEALNTPAETSATPCEPAPRYDLVAVIRHYLTLTPTLENENWDYCGPSPYLRGDTFSLAVNSQTGFYHCYATDIGGRALDFVMFMEECSQEEAFDWLDANFPIEGAGVEFVQEKALLPTTEPEAVSEIGIVADGPYCAYPGPVYGYGPGAEPLPEASNNTPRAEGDDTEVLHENGLLPDGSEFAALAELTADTTPPSVLPPVAVESAIYKTTDYDIFKTLAENRPISVKQVGKLVREIQRKNMLHIKPIDVTADMEVVDGQHRLAAARELGVPIY
jgi:hypothetical protein